jgi:amino acid adenylation domain-containing protein
VALIGEKRWTCRELNERANQLAHHLRARGVGPETLVGVCVERSPEMVLALVASLKAGGAYVPLDPSYPQDRVTFMLEDARPRVVLTQKRLRDRLPATGAEIVCIDDDAAVSGQSRQNLPRVACPDNAAYVMYTSGSTGQPKGVIGTHRATLNCLHWMWRDFPLRRGEICCQKTPLSFGDSIQEIFGPLLKGIPLAVIPDRDVRQPARLARTLASQRVTRIVLVPSLLRMLLDGVPNLAEQLPFLTLWIASGETLDLDLAERFERSLPHATLINMYGCSELSNDVTWCDTKGCARLGYVPIGKPIANLKVYALDERQQPAPLGVPGELCVAGAGVNRGYLNLPELTAEKFIPDPYGPVGSRLYRTGDRVRFRPDGSLEYLGRLDHQVKIRGMRVELGEIEAALSAHPDVTQAVAIVREDQPGHPRLAAYITARDGKPRYDTLRRFLATRLPEYMMPSSITVLDGFPSTPSGKVDRNALPAPSTSRPELSQCFVAPRGDAERLLASIWTELLHIERVGVDDNFFELGGDSILAVQMIARARDAGLSLAPKDLFQQQTVSELAALVEQNRSQVSAPPHDLLVAMHPGEDRPPLFCIHPIEGTVFGYAALARLLDNGQPVWGIRARGLEPGETPSQSLPVMADEYVGAIKSVQAEGPYYLCGWSMGGLLAYEIARRLRGLGDDIAFLAVLDQGPRADIRIISALAERLDAKPLAFLVEPSDRELAQLRHEREIAHWLPAVLDEAEINRHLRVYLRNWAALREYTAPPSHEHIWLFRTREPSDRDETLGWAAVARGGVEVQIIPGDHRGMMQFPHAAILARELRECLEVVFHESGNKPALSWK